MILWNVRVGWAAGYSPCRRLYTCYLVTWILNVQVANWILRQWHFLPRSDLFCRRLDCGRLRNTTAPPCYYFHPLSLSLLHHILFSLLASYIRSWVLFPSLPLHLPCGQSDAGAATLPSTNQEQIYLFKPVSAPHWCCYIPWCYLEKIKTLTSSGLTIGQFS